MYIEILEEDVHVIVNQIKSQFNFDLSGYSIPTLKRRINRIMMLFHLRNSKEFSGLLKNDPTIFPHILNELTVATTEMFRDISFWKTVKEKILPTFQNAPHFRVWHNACSSGEEVYSLLILAIELGFEKSVEIIASDVNTSRLKVAESGIFQLKFMKKYEAYYQQIGGKKSLFHYGEILGDHYFQFHESIRNKIKFSYLDCIQQPGFVQCDLVFTRNVLMYFTMELQQKVLFKLTECVKPNGYIFFGNNEDMSWVPDFSKYFRVSDKSSYQKI